MGEYSSYNSLSTLIAVAQDAPVDDTPAMNAIIHRFEPLTRGLARGMTMSRNDLFDDVANASRIALVRAVRRHDPSRPGFAAYAEEFMRGAALRELKRWQRQDALDEIAVTAAKEDLAVDRGNVERDMLDRLAPWGDGNAAIAIGRLSASQQHLATRRYVDDASLETIASASGTSVSAVSQRLTTIHRRVETSLAA